MWFLLLSVLAISDALRPGAKMNFAVSMRSSCQLPCQPTYRSTKYSTSLFATTLTSDTSKKPSPIKSVIESVKQFFLNLNDLITKFFKGFLRVQEKKANGITDANSSIVKSTATIEVSTDASVVPTAQFSLEEARRIVEKKLKELKDKPVASATATSVAATATTTVATTATTAVAATPVEVPVVAEVVPVVAIEAAVPIVVEPVVAVAPSSSGSWDSLSAKISKFVNEVDAYMASTYTPRDPFVPAPAVAAVTVESPAKPAASSKLLTVPDYMNLQLGPVDPFAA